MVCGFGDQVAYETLVRQIAKQTLDKSSRFTDWSHRPLTDAQKKYALADVTHLRVIYEILSERLIETGRLEWVNEELERFRFNEAAKAIYEFTWSDFCDWYIEIAKTRFYGSDKHKAKEAQVVCTFVIKGILTLLHPYAPFITEEIWSYFKNDTDKDLIVSPWLKGDRSIQNSESDDSVDLLKQLVTAIRTIRSSMNAVSYTHLTLPTKA